MEAPLPTTLAVPAKELPPLHPMTLGEVLDRALSIFRANFGRLLAMMLAFQAPLYALRKAMESVSTTLAHAQKNALTPLDLLRLLGDSALIFAGIFLFHQLAVAAHATAASRAFLGEPVEPGRALKEMVLRLPQILGTFLVATGWTAVATLLAMLPGAVLIAFPPGGLSPAKLILGIALTLLAAIVALLWFALRYALVTEVVMIERRSFFGAMRRSAELMSGRTGPSLLDGSKLRASILYAVNLCISIAVAVVTSIPTLLTYSAYGVSPFNPEAYDPSRVPFWAALPGDLLQVFASAALTPFGLLAMVVFYFDVRIKREGFDLEILATRMGAPR